MLAVSDHVALITTDHEPAKVFQDNEQAGVTDEWTICHNTVIEHSHYTFTVPGFRDMSEDDAHKAIGDAALSKLRAEGIGVTGIVTWEEMPRPMRVPPPGVQMLAGNGLGNLLGALGALGIQIPRQREPEIDVDAIEITTDDLRVINRALKFMYESIPVMAHVHAMFPGIAGDEEVTELSEFGHKIGDGLADVAESIEPVGRKVEALLSASKTLAPTPF